MSTLAGVVTRTIETHQGSAGAESRERSGRRRCVLLMEPDASLRSVLVRTLLRRGFVVSLQHEPEQVIAALQEGGCHGVIVALEPDSTWLSRLDTHSGESHVPIVALTYAAPGPSDAERLPGICFLQKPFDVADLYGLLNLR